ncbi:MAG: hypothetical protein JWQ44_221 [Chthoniobacter sp.]|nr:hypothetical protein [Chthoniobacter sp.]
MFFSRLLRTFACFLAVVPLAGAAPSVQTLNPTDGSTVAALTSVAITFSEAVTEVDADDLLINGDTALSVTGSGVGAYTFTFSQPVAGPVNVEFAGDNGIVGLANTGAFVPPLPWSYTLSDTIAPVATQLTPAAGSTLGVVTEVRVLFSESVDGVNASDLTVNGVAASAVTGSGQGPYLFTVTPPAAGAVTLAWVAGHGIQDTATTPNAFAGGSWNVTVSATGAGNLVINEFLAGNGVGIADENGDQEDWIEIHNPGASAVNLAGWALTDDDQEPTKWVFPSRTLNAGAYLVVFASAKNRRPASGNLHTNFKLNEGGGYLALIKPDSPSVISSSFAYPPQRFDYSYGSSAGQARYFTPPTPNAANSSTALTAFAAAPKASVGRGFFQQPFDLVLSTATPNATVRYTLDGSEPTATTGTVYTGPINISGTRVLRTAAFGTGLVPSATVTHSYIFLDQVLTQPNNPAGYPTNWGAHTGFSTGVVPADYEMDPQIVNDPLYTQMLKDGLRQLPIVSLVMPIADMFGPNGINTNPNIANKGFPAKKGSMEMVLPDGSTAFTITCGISAHGNASRDPLKNPKHGFKLKFKGDYGASKLEYRLFPDSPATEFEDLVLRADFGTSWRHWSDDSGNGSGVFQRSRGSRTRDAWVKHTARDMGVVAGHNRYCHLFINGLYWGTYDFTEQPTASFGATYFGGTESDYDIYEQGSLKNGTANAYNALTGLPAATTNAIYEQYKATLDVPEFIDYMMLHFYMGHQDWGLNKNWYAMRQRGGGTFGTEGKFRYIPWDGENVLLDTTVNRVPTAPSGTGDVPSGVHIDLDDNPQYRLDFADRVHKHMVAPDGALSPSANIARWQTWQAVMDKPIVAESARWGDYRRDVHPYQSGSFVLYTRNQHWMAENNRLVNSYFPAANRHNIVLNQFRGAGLYPNVPAPEFRQTNTSGQLVGSAQVNAGYVLAMRNPGAGTLHYTTNGVDPRVYYAGTVAAGAVAYSEPLTLNSTTTVKARVLNGSTWSALNEATFHIGVPAIPIAISELMYHPPGGDLHEFIELQNYGAETLDLGGFHLDGVDFFFPLYFSLAPGARVVLASNDDRAGFAAQYPGVVVAGYYGGSLSNGSETLTLYSDEGQRVVTVTYHDEPPWPSPADGGGYSLEIFDPAGDPDSAANWRRSANFKGTPGQANSLTPAFPMVINEVLAENQGAVAVAGGAYDYVELKNVSGAPVDLQGWTLFAAGTGHSFTSSFVVPAGGFAVVPCSPMAPVGSPRLAASIPTAGALVRLQTPGGIDADAIHFGNQLSNLSIGRVAGSWTLNNPTPNAENVAAPIAPVAGNLVINEWLSNAVPGGSDWLELFNKHATLPVPLHGLFFQTDSELFRFPFLAFLGAGQFLQLFADERPGVDQLDFKLPAAGTALSILDANGVAIDAISKADFGVLAEGISRGRSPDGSGTFSTFSDSTSPADANYINTYAGPALNEVLARNVRGGPAPWGTVSDWLEFHNSGTSAADLSGFRLSNVPDFGTAWPLPSGTTMAAGSYLTIWCDAEHAPSTAAGPDLNSGLDLGDSSGAVYLFDRQGRVVAQLRWGFQVANVSIGVSAGTWQALTTPTRGAANSAPAALGAVSALRINEWMAQPTAGGDWFELHNPSPDLLSLGGLLLTDDPSEPGVSKFRIPALSFIGPKSWVKWEASGATDIGRNHVNFSLDVAGESLRLSNSDSVFTPIDSVTFGLQTIGVSEGRILDGANNVVAMPGSPTPGARNVLFPSPSFTEQPASQTVAQGANVTFNTAASGSAPMSYQWLRNGSPVAGATNPTLVLNGVTTAQDGAYILVASNTAGSLSSNPAFLAVQTTFAQWATTNGVGAAGDDPDRDGLSNAAEFFHNLSPNDSASAVDRSALPKVGLEPGAQTYLTLIYRRSARAVSSSVQYELSSTLVAGSWLPATPAITENLGPDPTTGDPLIKVKFAVSPDDKRHFARLVITP